MTTGNARDTFIVGTDMDSWSPARRFDETMAQARRRLAAMRRASDALSALQKRPSPNRETVIDDLLEDLGTG